MFVKTMYVRDVDPAVLSPVAATPGPTDAPWRGVHLRIMAVVQDHQLDIAEDRLARIVIWAALGQRQPMQFQAAHRTACLDGLVRMRRVAIEHDPDLPIRVPPMELLHKATHMLGALAVVEGPTAPLPRRTLVCPHGVELSTFTCSRLSRLQGSRHGWTSCPGVVQPYSQIVCDKYLQVLCDNPLENYLRPLSSSAGR